VVAAAALQQQQQRQHQAQREEAHSEEDPDAAPQNRSRSGRLLKRSQAAQSGTDQASDDDEGGPGEEDSGGEWEARGHWRRNVKLPAAPEVRSRSGRVLRRATAPMDLSEEDSEEWQEATDSDSGFEGGGRRRVYPSAYDSGMLGAHRIICSGTLDLLWDSGFALGLRDCKESRCFTRGFAVLHAAGITSRIELP
jgi:hypothetical protein